MAIPFYESVLTKRLPVGSPSYTSMRDIKEETGWLGDTLSLNTYTYGEYHQMPRDLSWLPDSVTAEKWKEYVITGTVVDRKIGGASCRERVCQDGRNPVVAVT